ncbi:MAG: GntR family transcriptional regulator [Clostridia bacterium]|nr:GntR family transcriptional regulator [Clostridia bacterium]MBR3806185.1 GntR family transcriptional regulator [Clostridia bacterium]
MIIDNFAKSLEQSVFLKLEEEILNGELKKGESLTENSLSSRLGVSRTPIRAALHHLAEEGLVKIEANRGVTVVGVSETDLVDIYTIRMRLEGLASRAAASNISEEDLSDLRDSVELSEFYIRKRDAEHLKELDTRFHEIIYRASSNPRLDKILSELHRNIRVYRKLSLTVSDRLEKSVEEHREILSAIESGNAEEADRLMTSHISSALDSVLSAVEKQ